ncbi:hypothetical protein COV11_00575 [Candidatus Woesearchaeota archaeon CG10_big_fil_rev_8_21_14_0_10_30_7]|nr:MAG: hypothetical protein COV11_00575 [Candidatus Woesearchaeota archaeon CG10_big_fil_rev_8_21_14_0_10_30_7]
MPHQCVRCNHFYEDGSKEILAGCKCGAKLFFFIKKEKLAELKKEKNFDLSEEQKDQIEQDVFELIGVDNPTQPVILDFESIRVLTPGKYEVDIVQLFKGEPLVFKLEEGKYIIDLPTTFERLKAE